MCTITKIYLYYQSNVTNTATSLRFRFHFGILNHILAAGPSFVLGTSTAYNTIQTPFVLCTQSISENVSMRSVSAMLKPTMPPSFRPGVPAG